MTENEGNTLRKFQMAAYIVIAAWGIKSAAHILSIILIALLLTYAILPFPQWLMRRLRIPKGFAITLTLVFVVVVYTVISLVLVEAGLQMRDKLPLYEEHLRGMVGHVTAFLAAHGVHFASLSLTNWYSSDKLLEFARMVLPKAIGLFSDRVLIALLSLFFLVEMVVPKASDAGSLARGLLHYGGDVQRFIAISAETGAINAVVNLVLLVALRVDFAFVWCFLYFFLHFIPNVGFLLSIIPPALVALLMLGWKRALLVTGALILTEMLGDYVVTPMLMIKGLRISLLQIMLSLVIWGYLLGPAGAILAVPLTLALRRFIGEPLEGEELALAPEGTG